MKSTARDRPGTAGVLELHVFHVPEELWNAKLNTVSIRAIGKFISAGFIRVFPDLSLQALRQELGDFLGDVSVNDKFVYLKCVGRGLAVVKAKQELELKVKSFAPPYEVHNSSRVDLNNPFTWEEKEPYKNEPRSTPIKNKIHENKIAESSELQEDHRLPGKKETAPMADVKSVVNSVSKENRIQSNSTWDSGVPESLDDRDLDYLENERKKSQRLNLEQETSNVGKIVGQMQGDDTEVQYAPVRKIYSMPSLPHQLVLTTQSQQIQSFPTDDQLIAQIKAMRQERKHLEKSRGELVKRARGLLSQNQLRRNQARDSWKKKYFECKKATAPLEEMSNTLRHELETHYLKLLRQLEARDARKQPRNVTNASSSKNKFIIQIATLKHEIDQLYRKVENAKMKLMTEIKLRNQAATELRALRAELVQKKAQSSQTRLHGGSVPQSLNRLAIK
ncbi:spermatogenesis-associated protein 1 isoform X3 [Callorhinchus milii]|uniref:spermatogenesis-associated protein 1 isoform X3 n=1 Tax=Callorhinchus milii TaxID=7868 RepID=UPI0004571595|nr:spermatogenesis-associated protein 1 isoform X3 [Callorhinchus milii]|eukprot:gi/632940589/ref/XP_007885399.1/ PREDICTED: spermatogenesis-associated protein 1 isoform X2 [Callorhinchus milii]